MADKIEFNIGDIVYWKGAKDGDAKQWDGVGQVMKLYRNSHTKPIIQWTYRDIGDLIPKKEQYKLAWSSGWLANIELLGNTHEIVIDSIFNRLREEVRNENSAGKRTK